MIRTNKQEPIRYRNYRFYLNSLTPSELFVHKKQQNKAYRKIKKQKKSITEIYNIVIISMILFTLVEDSHFGIDTNYMLLIDLIFILAGAGLISWFEFKLDRIEEKIMIFRVVSLENYLSSCYCHKIEIYF